MTAIPPITTQPRRFIDASTGHMVEPIEHPLFSAVALDAGALPQELTFFGYGRGDPVPGTGNAAGMSARPWHTNLDKGGLLGRPKTFTATGLRFYFPPLAFGAANVPSLPDAGFGAAAVNSDQLDDLMLAFFSGHVRFEVGQKVYADEPLFLCPGNVGITGAAAVAASTNAAVTSQTVDYPHTEGKERSFLPYPVKIDMQQAFSLTVSWPWATRPSMVDARYIVAILDGKLSREVQ